MITPPDTLAYMIAGYAVILGSLVAYVASLALRWRRLKYRIKEDSRISPDQDK